MPTRRLRPRPRTLSPLVRDLRGGRDRAPRPSRRGQRRSTGHQLAYRRRLRAYQNSRANHEPPIEQKTSPPHHHRAADPQSLFRRRLRPRPRRPSISSPNSSSTETPISGIGSCKQGTTSEYAESSHSGSTADNDSWTDTTCSTSHARTVEHSPEPSDVGMSLRRAVIPRATYKYGFQHRTS